VLRSEYLSLDVTAFGLSIGRWPFPVAVFELENSRHDDQIAYSMWTVVTVRAHLRIVFCYRSKAELGVRLVRYLEDTVIEPQNVSKRTGLGGETFVVVGGRDEASTFPYGFFKRWKLDLNTG